MRVNRILQIIIFSCFMLLSINSVLIQTILLDNDSIKNIIRLFVIVLIAFIIFIKKIKINNNIMIILLFISILFLITKNMDLITYIFLFIVVQLLIRLDDKTVLKYLTISSVVAFSLIFIFLLLGVTQNEILDYRNRMTFGVGNSTVNRIPFFYNMVYGTLTLIILYINKYYKKINSLKVIIYILTLTLATYFYIKTNLRGGYLCFIIFIVLTWIIPKIYKFRFVKYISCVFYIIMFTSSFIIASFHENIYLDKLLSYRPTYVNNFIKSINIGYILLSRSVKSMDTITIVDNSYIHIFIGGGIIIFLIILFLYYISVKNLYNLKYFNEIAFIISTSIYFNIESIAVRIENMFVIYWWYLIINYSIKSIRCGQKFSK